MSKVSIIVFLFSVTLFGEIKFKTGEKIRLSENYYSGPHLIYDCKRQFWACVDKDGKSDCKKRREESIKEYASVLGCAYFKEYSRLTDCYTQQVKQMSAPIGLGFCLHPDKQN